MAVDIQKVALEELKVEAEQSAIYQAKHFIRCIADQQRNIANAQKQIGVYKKQLAEVKVEEYSV